MNKPQLWSTIAWVCWVVQGLVLEFLTIAFFGDGDTLSENVWYLLEWMGTQPWSSAGYAFVSMALIGFCGWLPLHFLRKVWDKI